MNSAVNRAVSSGCSNCGTCPQSSRTTGLGGRQGFQHEPAVCGRDEHVPVAPQEQRRRLERRQPAPQAAGAERLVQKHVPQRREGGEPVGTPGEHAEELVDRRLVPGLRQPGGVGEEVPQPTHRHPPGHQHRDHGDLITYQSNERHELAQPAQRHRRAQQHQAAHAVRTVERRLQCGAPTQAVPDQDGRLGAGLLQEREQPRPEEGGSVCRAGRVGTAVSGQVGGEHPIALRQGRDQRQHRGVGRRQSVHQDHRRGVGRTRLEVERLDSAGTDRPRVGAGVVGRVAREQAVELQRQRQVAAHGERATEKGVDAAAASGHHVVEHR